MALRLVVGLGNPGAKYAETRHNVGFRVVELLQGRWHCSRWTELCDSLVSATGDPDSPTLLAKPQTYMNRSGAAAKALLDRWPVELSSVLVIHDDLDLPFGSLRIRTGGGNGGHNGVRSMIEALGSGDFLRLKIGIGRPESREDVVDYVLSPFNSEDASALPAVLERAADAADCILADGPTAAMNRFHS